MLRVLLAGERQVQNLKLEAAHDALEYIGSELLALGLELRLSSPRGSKLYVCEVWNIREKPHAFAYKETGETLPQAIERAIDGLVEMKCV